MVWLKVKWESYSLPVNHNPSFLNKLKGQLSQICRTFWKALETPELWAAMEKYFPVLCEKKLASSLPQVWPLIGLHKKLCACLLWPSLNFSVGGYKHISTQMERQSHCFKTLLDVIKEVWPLKAFFKQKKRHKYQTQSLKSKDAMSRNNNIWSLANNPHPCSSHHFPPAHIG